jgi:hypothetical protein
LAFLPHEELPEEYYKMITVHAREAIEKFMNKAVNYPPEGFQFLGEKGQFSDIARKFFKLKKVIWDGEPLNTNSESIEEVIEDFIGHCLIMLWLLES